MSGGIDSTATLSYATRARIRNSGSHYACMGEMSRRTPESWLRRMGIEHYVADERIPFKETIVKNFIDEYKQGRTPNPCVMCNPLFKFRVLTEWADKLGCAWVATGHYSRLEERKRGIFI